MIKASNKYTDKCIFLHIYHKVACSNTSHLEAHAGFFRLLMKVIFYAYVLWPFDKEYISWLVMCIRSHYYTVYEGFWHYSSHCQFSANNFSNWEYLLFTKFEPWLRWTSNNFTSISISWHMNGCAQVSAKVGRQALAICYSRYDAWTSKSSRELLEKWIFFLPCQNFEIMIHATSLVKKIHFLSSSILLLDVHAS